jgi:hypothetical protein
MEKSTKIKLTILGFIVLLIVIISIIVYFSIPAETSVPTPAENSVPTPAETSVPTPAETSVPTPAETSVPTPAEISVPTPAETTVPTPAETSVPTPAETLSIIIKGRTGLELFEIKNLDNEILLNNTLAIKDGLLISLDPNLKSFIIHFKNDNSSNDIFLTKIIKNGLELNKLEHIRADLRFPIENPRYKSVANGNFLWGGEYRIDL